MPQDISGGSMSITPERKEKVTFLPSHYKGGVSILVRQAVEKQRKNIPKIKPHIAPPMWALYAMPFPEFFSKTKAIIPWNIIHNKNAAHAGIFIQLK